jgi:hypothetical protein
MNAYDIVRVENACAKCKKNPCTCFDMVDFAEQLSNIFGNMGAK